MIREYRYSDLFEINELLKEFNYKLSKESFENEFLKVLVYADSHIKGVLVYEFIYDRIEIDYIVVDGKFKRTRIASKLLDYMENENRKIKNITLEVRKSNVVAINFYKKNGFNEVTIRKNYYNSEDGILMIKNLGE